MRTHELEVTTVRIDKVLQHPDNANMGDLDLIEESIEINGFYKPLLVQRSTGYILVGNHSYVAAYRQRATEIPVIYLDVDDTAAKRIMVADNATNRAGRDDEALIADVLLDLRESELALRGTGYEDDELRRLLKQRDEPLDFDKDPVEKVRDEVVKNPMNLNAFPILDSDGMVTEIALTRIGDGPFTQQDFQKIRLALGLSRAGKDEIKAYDILAWK